MAGWSPSSSKGGSSTKKGGASRGGWSPGKAPSAKGSGGKKKEGGGDGGFSLSGSLKGAAGAVMRSPVGGALRTLDLGRAAVVSTVREVDDFTEGRGFSGSDLRSNINRRMGVGDWAEENESGLIDKDSNINVKRAVGFVGDVALDPTTYLTLGGATVASQSAKGAARLSSKEVGEMAARRGMTEAADKVLKNRTATVLSKAEREALGVNVGASFGVGRARVAVPALEWTSALRARATNPAADAILKTRLGAKTRDVFDVKKAFSALRQTDNGHAKVAQAQGTLRKAEAIGQGFKRKALLDLNEVVKAHKDVDGAAAVRAIEDPSLRGLDPQVDAAAADISAYLERNLAEAERITGTTVARFQDYVPHQLADEFREALAESTYRPSGGAGKQAFERGRGNRVGQTWFGQTLERGTLDEMEEIAKEALGANYQQVFRDDPWVIAKAYANGLSRMVEREQFFKGLDEFGLTKDLDSAGLTVGRLGSPEPEVRIKGEEKIEGRINKSLDKEAARYDKAAVAQRKIAKAEQTIRDNQSQFDQAVVARNLRDTNQARLNEIDDELSRTNPGTRKGQKLVEEAERRTEADRLLAASLKETDPVLQQIARLEASAQNHLAKAAKEGDRGLDLQANLGALRQRQTELQAMVDEGLREMTQGKWADPAVADLVDEVIAWNKPEQIGKLLATTDWLMSRWKAQALMTPGFNIRNLYGGIFNNDLAGVGRPAYRKFAVAARQWRKGGVDAVADPQVRPIIAEMERYGLLGASDNIRDVSDVGMANGTSREGLVAKGMRKTGKGGDRAQKRADALDPTSMDFAGYRANRFVAGHVEEELRGALFLDRMLKGFDAEDALAATHKYHFDYSDLAKWESSIAKRLIPFYTWSRKNLPLQIEGMLSKPGTYTKFLSAKRNIEVGTEKAEDQPLYYEKAQAIQTPFEQGGNPIFAMPDLPFIGMEETVGTQALSGLNPVIKTPLEMWGNRNAFTGFAIENTWDEPAEVPGAWKWLMPVLEQLEGVPGMPQVREGADGETVMTKKDLHKIESLVPLLGRARRLAPSEEKYQQRHLSAILSTMFGVGARTLTPEEQEMERRRKNGEFDK